MAGGQAKVIPLDADDEANRCGAKVKQVGEMAKTSKPGSSKSNRRTSDVGCPEAVPFPHGGVIMPHVVSPEITGGEVTTPPIVPPGKLEQSFAREER